MRNVGFFDRVIRVILTALIFYAYFVGWITGWVAIAAGFVAAIFLVTAITAECPLYKVLGISTKSKMGAS